MKSWNWEQQMDLMKFDGPDEESEPTERDGDDGHNDEPYTPAELVWRQQVDRKIRNFRTGQSGT